MAAKDQSEIDLDIQALLMHMGDGGKDIDQKCDELLKKYKREPEPILEQEIEAAKKCQEKSKEKRIVHFMPRFHQPDERANLEAQKEEGSGKEGFNPSGVVLQTIKGGDELEPEMPSLTSSSGEIEDVTEDLKNAESGQHPSEILEQDTPSLASDRGDMKEEPSLTSSSGEIEDVTEDLKNAESGPHPSERLEQDTPSLANDRGDMKEETEERQKEGSAVEKGIKMGDLYNDQDRNIFTKYFWFDLQKKKLGNVESGQKIENVEIKKARSDQFGSSKPTAGINIKKFGRKMLALVPKVNKDRHQVKENNIVKELKNAVAMQAAKLCRLLVCLIFSLSEMEEMAGKFRKLNSVLKWLIEDEDSIVTCRIIALLEFVDKKFLNTGGLKDAELHGEISVAKEAGCLIHHRQVNQLIHQFFHEILCLENILKRKPDSKISVNDLVSSAEAELKEFENELKRIESRMIELEKPCGCYSAQDDLGKYREVELKISDLCKSEEIGDLKRYC